MGIISPLDDIRHPRDDLGRLGRRIRLNQSLPWMRGVPLLRKNRLPGMIGIGAAGRQRFVLFTSGAWGCWFARKGERGQITRRRIPGQFNSNGSQGCAARWKMPKRSDDQKDHYQMPQDGSQESQARPVGMHIIVTKHNRRADLERLRPSEECLQASPGTSARAIPTPRRIAADEQISRPIRQSSLGAVPA